MAPACDAAGVKAFPTWVINGQKIEGQQSLEALAALLDGASSVGSGL
jgi:protein-disulfide isomerase